jgi:DNA-binding FadR family transcriptional regulator
VLEAIVAGDADQAERRMRRLVDVFAERLSRPVQGQRRRPSVEAAPSGKLAERVADAIREDIEAAGWPVGEVIGSEVDLIERHGVSRAILREAVRILEHHGAVRTKRGPHGGLVVTEPNVSAVVHAARLVLEHGGVSPESVFAMRSAVEITAARLAAERRQPDDAVRLKEVLAVEADTDIGALHFQDLHAAIADTARNRPVRLFVDVAAELVEAHLPIPVHRGDVVPAELHRAHELIVEAIIAGDVALAERRMTKHLRAGVRIFA